MKIRLRDIEVAYDTQGQGPPVVMLHGLAEDRRSWADARARLSAFHTYAYDLRGHGETEAGDADGTLDQLGGDLIAFLETVTGPARCVGYSLGGTIVLWAAATRPELIAHAVVSGTSTVVGRVAVDFFADRIRTLREDRARFAAELRADTVAQIVTEHAQVDAVAARRLEAVGDGDGYVNAARAMMRLREQPLTPMLQAIRCPVDVIGADGDVFCPRKAADIICEALRDPVYHEIAGAGHLMSVDQPDAYAHTLARALERSI